MARKTSSSSNRRRLNNSNRSHKSTKTVRRKRSSIHDGDENIIGDATEVILEEDKLPRKKGIDPDDDGKSCSKDACFCYLRRGGMFMPPPTTISSGDSLFCVPITSATTILPPTTGIAAQKKEEITKHPSIKESMGIDDLPITSTENPRT